MSVTGVHKDPAARTMTITSEFAAPIARVWQLWADPRQLERWWGPPTHPATVVEHDLSPGGKVSYFVTGPEGDRMTGWWNVLTVGAPARLTFEMGDPSIPTMTVQVGLADRPGGGTRMVIEVAFAAGEDMDLLIGMGFAEGLSTAINQIDALL
jgi:uncharacterized protein YndB with AHSA1/START domain